MTQQYMTPQRPKRPASRLVAGLLWLVAAATAVGATFADIVIYEFAGGAAIFVVGFWRQYGLDADGGVNSPGSIYYGAAEVAAAALLLLAALLVFLSARRWAAMIAGAFGTGMLVTSVLTWFLTALSEQANNTTTIEPGLWVLTGATLVALVAFLVSFAERTRPAPRPSFAPPAPPPSPPSPQPRWEPETPKYGIPIQQEQPQQEQQPPAKQREEPAVRDEEQAAPQRPAVGNEEDVFVEAFDHPEFTGNGSRPGQFSRKPDGDVQ